MRVVVQRVSSARVTVDGVTVGEIGSGLLLLGAVHREDTVEKIERAADRCFGLRIFNDDAGKMNLSLSDLRTQGQAVGILAISNFTVYGDAVKSRRPSFTGSAGYDDGREGFHRFVQALKKLSAESEIVVQTGEFGADMKVELVNDGPVTLIIET
jgi:D-tyrosyl-tRNA(Tyr) deacylase